MCGEYQIVLVLLQVVPLSTHRYEVDYSNYECHCSILVKELECIIHACLHRVFFFWGVCKNNSLAYIQYSVLVSIIKFMDDSRSFYKVGR